jgi:hypothetical protein
MINKVYSMLLKGVQPGSSYFNRRCTGSAYHADPLWTWLGDMLVPASSGAGYSQYCAEQIVQVVRKSLLKDSLEAFDPMNTYRYEFDVVAPSTVKGGLPAGLYCDLLEPADLKEWVELDAFMVIDSVAGTISVDGVSQDLSWDAAGRQSAVIPVATGLSIRMRGTLASCSFNMHLVRPPVRDLRALVAAMRDGSIPWHADYSQYKDSSDPDTWLAAAVLSYCRKLE